MGFIPAPNIPGRVFVPDENPVERKKHICPDCYQCQQCGEERCQVCRADRECRLDEGYGDA